MDVYKAIRGLNRLISGRIPRDSELEELFACASSKNPKIPEDIQDESFREWMKNHPFNRCLGLLGAFTELVKRIEYCPEIGTYLVFKAAVFEKELEIGEDVKKALDFFLKSYCLTEFDVERYISESRNRN